MEEKLQKILERLKRGQEKFSDDSPEYLLLKETIGLILELSVKNDHFKGLFDASFAQNRELKCMYQQAMTDIAHLASLDDTSESCKLCRKRNEHSCNRCSFKYDEELHA